MAAIKVHLLNFHGVISSHIEIVCENISLKYPTYYSINRWDMPQSVWLGPGCAAQTFISDASSVYHFIIEADPDEITQKWQKYYNRTFMKASIIGENCAVASQWFLTEFAGIPKPRIYSGLSFNYLSLGIVWPSFLPCPIKLPGRIMSHAKFCVPKRIKFGFAKLSSLPVKHNNKYKSQATALLQHLHAQRKITEPAALHKFNSLMMFYEKLKEIELHTDILRKNGYKRAADTADTLVKQLSAHTKNYLQDTRENAYQNFKTNCFTEIQAAKPELAKHRGWKRLLANLALFILSLGVGYLAACAIKAAVTGNILFFNDTRSLGKLDKLVKSLPQQEITKIPTTRQPILVY